MTDIRQHSRIPPSSELYLIFKASQLSRRHAIWGLDRKDIEQEFRLDLLRRLPAYDPEKASPETFCSRLIAHRIAELTRPSLASIAGRRTVSINQNVDGDGDDVAVSFGENLPESAGIYANETFDVETRTDLKIDIEAFISGLPDDLRECAKLLMEHPASYVARICKIHRSTLYARIERIRNAAIKVGLHKYIGATPTA